MFCVEILKLFNYKTLGVNETVDHKFHFLSKITVFSCLVVVSINI